MKYRAVTLILVFILVIGGVFLASCYANDLIDFKKDVKVIKPITQVTTTTTQVSTTK